MQKEHDWQKEHRENVESLDQGLVTLAVIFLKDLLKEDADKIRQSIAEDPQTWWSPYHFNWGMAVRNDLRSEGYGENEFDVENLDDYYIGLVELAMQ